MKAPVPFTSRLAGLALCYGAPLTVALGAIVFFLLPIVAPLAAIEGVIGVRMARSPRFFCQTTLTRAIAAAPSDVGPADHLPLADFG